MCHEGHIAGESDRQLGHPEGEGGREGRREGGREGERERGREGGRERGREGRERV